MRRRVFWRRMRRRVFGRILFVWRLRRILFVWIRQLVFWSESEYAETPYDRDVYGCGQCC